MSRVSDSDWLSATALAADGDKAKFLRAVGVPPNGVSAWIQRMLADALASHDGDMVEFGLIVATAFEAELENADTLTRLLGEDWHHSHENIVSSLQDLTWSPAVPALVEVAATEHPYLAYDNETGLRLKVLHALHAIGTPDAIAGLRSFTVHGDPEVAAAARRLLGE